MAMVVSVNLGAEENFNHTEENFERSHDDSSEWSFSIGADDFNKIIKQYSSSDDIFLGKFMCNTCR